MWKGLCYVVRSYVSQSYFRAVPNYVVCWKITEVLTLVGPEKVEVSVCPLADFWKSIAFWKVPRLCPLVLVRASCRWRWVWSVGGMILVGAWPIGTFSATYSRWTELGWNPGLRGERPAGRWFSSYRAVNTLRLL